MGKYLHKVEVTEQDHREAYDYKYSEPWVSYCTAADQNTPNVLYNKTYEELVNTPLTFYFPEGGTMKFEKSYSANTTLQVQISRNGENWWTVNAGNGWEIDPGGWVQFKGDNSTYKSLAYFSTVGDSYVFGNIMSLLSSTNFPTLKTISTEGAFQWLFQNAYGSDIIDASGLVFPAETLSNSCYKLMFNQSNKLQKAPRILPAMNLKEDCYNQMFSGCSGLLTVPKLSATSLATGCYKYMFSGCTSLKYCPKLPATELASNCYEKMFESCTGITESPELPATVLKSYCYAEMFHNCTGLTTANAIKATTLAPYCCYFMFDDCTSLVTVPDLLAEVAENYCYYEMFYNCKSLENPPKIFLKNTAGHCCQYMFSDCKKLKSMPLLPEGYSDYCYYAMFRYCELLKHAYLSNGSPVRNYCCQYMFYGCTGLEYARLSPNMAGNWCYNQTFGGCSNLKTIECFAPKSSNTAEYTGWLNNVSNVGTFITSKNSTWEAGSYGIPSGWTILKVE